MAEANKPYIGGQAVIEGVMMRAPACLSVAVRRPDGSLVLREGPLKAKWLTGRWMKVPGVRGVLTLVESLSLGFGALKFSAEQQMTEEERQQDDGAAAIWISVLLALGLFIALPQGMTGGVAKLVGADWSVQDPMFHLVTGGFKLLVFTAYLSLISLNKDVRRVFQYHGAEHKTIYAYEQGLPLTVENVREQSTLHPRCGTTFLVMVIAVSIVLGAVATPLLLPNVDGWLAQVLTLLLRIALLPLIAAVSFELQRFTAKFCTQGPLRVLLWPGFMFQKITTREPEDAQIEVAITAMEAARWRETAGKDAVEGDEPLVFESFAGFAQALPALRG